MRQPLLVPELICQNLDESLAFYCGVLGFRIDYQRPEDRFAYLERDGIEIMLEERGDNWITGELERPFGRGVNFQMEVEEIGSLVEALTAAGPPFYQEPEDKWYRMGEVETGNRQFLIQDPDGYLLRFYQDLGTRPAKARLS